MSKRNSPIKMNQRTVTVLSAIVLIFGLLAYLGAYLMPLPGLFENIPMDLKITGAWVSAFIGAVALSISVPLILEDRVKESRETAVTS